MLTFYSIQIYFHLSQYAFKIMFLNLKYTMILIITHILLE